MANSHRSQTDVGGTRTSRATEVTLADRDAANQLHGDDAKKNHERTQAILTRSPGPYQLEHRLKEDGAGQSTEEGAQASTEARADLAPSKAPPPRRGHE